MMTLGIITCALVLVLCLAPFFLGKGTAMQAGASINSVERLEAEKKALVKRYVEEEQAYDSKVIGKLSWEQRRHYLVNRYIDASKRQDFLKFLAEAEGGSHDQAD